MATRAGPFEGHWDSQGRDRPSRLKAVAGRAREEGDGCEQCGKCGAVQGRPGVMLRRAVLLATPRASTRERPDGADAERTDSAASPRSPSLVVVRVVDREESADAR